MAAQLDANGLPPLQTLPTPPPREPEPEPAPASATRPPKRWAEVIANPRFQALSSQEQEEARNQYFDEVVRPQIGADEVAEARKQFDADTKIGKLSGFAHDARQTLDKAADVAGPVIDRGLQAAGKLKDEIAGEFSRLPENSTVKKVSSFLDETRPAQLARGGLVSRGRQQTAVNTGLPVEARALLDTIAGTESPGYNTRYGGKTFAGFADHPRIGQRIERGPNAGKVSRAAGRYQFITGTWDAQAKKLGLKDFSPENQDLAAWDLAEEVYKSKTNRNLLEDLRSTDPSVHANVGRVLSDTWTSLPGGIEATTHGSRFSKEFNRNLQRESGQPQTARAEPPTNNLPEDLKAAAVKPAYVDTVRAKWDAAGPGERASMLADGGVLGRVARHVQKQYDDADAVMSLNAGLGGIGTRREDREDAYLGMGLDLPTARKRADEDLALGVPTKIERPRPSLAEQVESDWQRGVLNTQAMGAGLGAWAMDVVGQEDKARNLLADYQNLTQEASMYAPVVGDFANIGAGGAARVPEDVARYLTEAVVSNLPNFLPSLALGGLGGIAARKAAQGAVTGLVEKLGAARAAEFIAEKAAAGAQGFAKIGKTAEAIKAQGAAQLAQQGLQAALKDQAGKTALGAAAGAGAASVGMETGSIYGDIYDQTGQMRPGVAGAAGLAAGALDAIPAMRAATKLVGPEVTQQVAGTVMSRLGREAGIQFLSESGTEFLQTLIENGAVHVVDGKPLVGEQDIHEALNAALQGGIAGGVMGAATQGVSEARQASELPARAQIGAALQDAVDKAKIEFWDPQTQTDLTDDDLARLRMDPKRVGDPRQAPAALARQGVQAENPQSPPVTPSSPQSPEFSSYYPPSTLHTEPADAQERRRVAGTTRQDHQFDGRADALPEPDAARAGRGRGAELAGTAGTTGDAGVDAGGVLQREPGADRPAGSAPGDTAAPDFGKGDVEPKAEKPSVPELPARGQESTGTNWDELTPAEREGKAAQAGWRTQKGAVNAFGKKLALKAWADIPPDQQAKLQAVDSETEAKDEQVQAAPGGADADTPPLLAEAGGRQDQNAPAKKPEASAVQPADGRVPPTASRPAAAVEAGGRDGQGAAAKGAVADADRLPEGVNRARVLDSEGKPVWEFRLGDKRTTQPLSAGMMPTEQSLSALGLTQPASGPPNWVEHVTAKSKTLRGIVRKDLTAQQAKQIDPFTFKKDGGFFIRDKHVLAEQRDGIEIQAKEFITPAVVKAFRAWQASGEDTYFGEDGRRSYSIEDSAVHDGLVEFGTTSTQGSPRSGGGQKVLENRLFFRKSDLEAAAGQDKKPAAKEETSQDADKLTIEPPDDRAKKREYKVKRGEVLQATFQIGRNAQPQNVEMFTVGEPQQREIHKAIGQFMEQRKADIDRRWSSDPRAQQHAEVGAALVGLGWVSTREGVYEREIANVRPRGTANVTSGVWLVKFQGPMAIIERGWNDVKMMLADNWSAEKNAQRIHERVDAMADKERLENGILPAKPAEAKPSQQADIPPEFSDLTAARNHLIDLRTQAQEQGRLSDARLQDRIQRQERLIKQMEAETATTEESSATVKESLTVEPEAQPDTGRPAEYGKSNRIVSEEAYLAARERLRKKLSQLNAGLDPEMLMDGITAAMYHIESGARRWADYAKAMVADLGEAARPFLRSFYEGARHYPGLDKEGLDSSATLDRAEQYDIWPGDTWEPKSGNKDLAFTVWSYNAKGNPIDENGGELLDTREIAEFKKDWRRVGQAGSVAAAEESPPTDAPTEQQAQERYDALSPEQRGAWMRQNRFGDADLMQGAGWKNLSGLRKKLFMADLQAGKVPEAEAPLSPAPSPLRGEGNDALPEDVLAELRQDQNLMAAARLTAEGKNQFHLFRQLLESKAKTAVMNSFGADRLDMDSVDRHVDTILDKDAMEQLARALMAESAPDKSPNLTDSSDTGAGGKEAARLKGLIQYLTERLRSGMTITWRELFAEADKAFGGTQGQGTYAAKEAYDALEAAVNRVLYGAGRDVFMDPQFAKTPEQARATIEKLHAFLEQLPTQTKRDEEMDEFQQFSTPPALAYAANWVANLNAADVFMEPSAGTGDLAVWAARAGLPLILNELSPRRARLLPILYPEARVFQENAEQLDNVLPDDAQPTVVVMNPPFSSTAGRVRGERRTMNGGKHIEQALHRLAPGGRLVAIVGQGMADDAPPFREWWARIKRDYTVRANVGIDGKTYAKYGTTFDNRILVIDKSGPTTTDPVTGFVADPKDLPALLQEVRNDRPIAQPARQPGQPRPAESGSAAAPAQGEAAGQPGSAPRPQPDAVVARPKRTLAGRGTGRGGSPVDGADGSRPGPGDAVSARPGRDGGRNAGPDGAETGTADGRRGVAAGGRADERDAGDRRPTAVELDSPVADAESRAAQLTDSVFTQYAPQKVRVKGAKPHPGALVESAAMGSIQPVQPTYTPNLPAEVIQDGLLSDAQLEAVVYAGQAHEQLLPNGERRGFFIGDGTGVGKGREIAGIILDNWRQGRKKAVWVSFNKGLLKDAKRDFSGVTGDKNLLFLQGKTKVADALKPKEGILFTTYSTLRGAEKKQVAKAGDKEAKKRLQQIVDWLGPDFDGVIVFDEAHKMGNATAIKGQRGTAKASQQAIAGINLQAMLPKARVVYVSATGATEVRNLSYATRLGLWGEGTNFGNAAEFVNQINSGGVAAMELVARDMKALGMYIARSLSFDGVTYARLDHDLTPLQTDIYNELAQAWQSVLAQTGEALAETGQALNSDAKGAAMSKFWGSHQRFFNQVITSMQMPTVLEDMRKQLDAGHSIVVQLVNTNEAEQERQAARAAADETPMEEMDFTPRQTLIEYVRRSFPVQQFETFTLQDGSQSSRPVKDSEGKPVLNKAMVKQREALIETLEAIRVPGNPIDEIIDAFGPEQVAEVTGRGRRFVRERGADGQFTVKEQKRGASSNEVDAQAFQAGDKRVLIFSDAGGTGYSFHADNTAKNRQKRIHYLLQPGWRADGAMQGTGRSHRTNQAQPPHYVLPTTNLKAQKRFVSSIARRMDQMGALTRGQRQATSQGLFNAADNLENDYAAMALQNLLWGIDDIPGFSGEELLTAMGLPYPLPQDKQPTMPRFLNRLLSLTMEQQDAVFGRFEELLQQIVERHIQEGTYETGLENLKAESVRKLDDQTVFTDERTGAETHFVTLEVEQKVKYDAFDTVNTYPTLRSKHWMQDAKGMPLLLVDQGKQLDNDGKEVHRGMLWSPRGRRYIENYAEWKAGVQVRWGHNGRVETKLGEVITSTKARKLWDEVLPTLPKTRKKQEVMLTGVILPIWSRIGGNPRIMRTVTDDGEMLLGRLLSEAQAEKTRQKLGLQSPSARLPVADQFALILGGKPATLADGARIESVRVSNETRLELKPSRRDWPPGRLDVLRQQGMIVERINWQERVFIPTGDAGLPAFKRLAADNPVTDIHGLESEDDAPKFSRRAGGKATITVDGKERPRLNSEGRPIHPTEAGIRNFWRWFGDSRVVDAEGRPLVVYHGTMDEFASFKTNSYFTSSSEEAGTVHGDYVIPVYLSLANPFPIDDFEQVAFAGYDEELMRTLKTQGYDGMLGPAYDDRDSYFVAFDPNQIKSAIGNTGDFSAGKDDINFSRDTLMAGGRDGDPVAQADDQAAAEALNAGMVRYFKDKRWENAYVQVELPDALSEFQQAVAAGFGRELVGVIGRTRGARAINGVNYQGKLFVNVNADVGFVQLGGHELLHQLKRDRPDLYRWFAARARNHYRDLPAYQAKLNALLKPGEDPYNRAAAEEELLSDFAGDALADPAFVEKLAKADPSRFKQLLNAVIRWLKQVGERLTGKGLGSSQYFKDVEALREHLATALVAYAQGGSAAVGKMQRAKFHTAWHGSPHDHDKFSTSKIGTGEGAQAFGWGLYFSNAREIAEYYKEILSTTEEKLAPAVEYLNELERAVSNGASHMQGMLDKQRAIVGQLKSRLNGKLYQVELAPAEDEYLDWHKPLSEQSAKVKAAIDQILQEPFANVLRGWKENGAWDGMPVRGEALYSNIAAKLSGKKNVMGMSKGNLGGQKAASEYLHSLGIRGIRYPAEGQTGGKSGDRFNYVIFDENDVEITAKFSRAGQTIDVDGVQRPTTNSEGRPIHPTEAGLRNFWRWFGDSRVVDAEGRPLVVYHGSGESFDVFDASRLGENTGYGDAEIGFHFSDNNADADFYATKAAERLGNADGVVRQFYLRIKNPLIVGMDESDGNAGDRTQDFLDDKNVAKEYAEEHEHDGIVYLYGTNVDSGYTAIVFKPNQIKSAIGNTGDFSPDNDDIRFSRRSDLNNYPDEREGTGLELDPEAWADVDADTLFAAIDGAGKDGGGAWGRAGEAFDALSGQARRQVLGLLTVHQLVEQGGKVLPRMERYLDEMNRMDATRGRIIHEADAIAADWRKLDAKTKQRLAYVMHESTIAGVDGAVDYTPAIDVGAAKKRIKALYGLQRGAGGDKRIAQWQEEIRDLKAQLGFEEQREQEAGRILALYAALPEEAKAVYERSRDFHVDQSKRVEEALVAMIERAEMSGKRRAAAIQQLKKDFESQRVQAPYFPLARQGDYWVSVAPVTDEDGKVLEPAEFHTFQSYEQQSRFFEERGAEGRQVARGLKTENLQEVQGVSAGFVADTLDVIGQLGDTNPAVEDVRDQVYQLYLKSLPELSSRKHSIHRKKTRGFGDDALRAFAEKASHDAYAYARIQHGFELRQIMETLGEDLKAAGSAYQRGRMRERREWLEEFRDDVLNAGMGYQGVEGRMYDMDAKAAAVAQGAEGRRMTPGEQFVMDEAKKWRQFFQWMRNWASSGRGPNWVNEQLRDLSIREDTVKRISQRERGTEFAGQAYAELQQAYKHLMNPTTGRFAVAINSVGYLFHLAASPAAWVTNALQTPVISMPFVAARHGLGKTTKAFNRAFQDAMRDAWKMQTGKEHRFGIFESLTKPDEINAYTEALDRGLIERGRVMDLIGTAEEGARRSEASRRWALAMSFGFHDAERLNREMTFMAAYRLERDTGASFETAVNYAAKVVNDTHFNYAAENRARFMRSDFARVITQFKSYAQHVTYLQWRAVSEALGQDATPEQKKEARRFLLASTAVQFAAAGAAGLPLNLWLGIAAAKSGAAAVKKFGLAGALAWTGLVIGAMVGLGGDDPDDPIDWGAEIRQALADAFGPTGGTLVSEGLFNALAGIDMSSRLSQRELWWRDIDAEVDDRQLPLEVLSQLLGAGVGTGLQILEGLRIASDGQTERGIEKMLPKMPKDLLQAARFADEGALSLKGDPLIEEFTPWEISAKAAGFTPSRLAARYQENQANVTREKRIEERRADLTRDLAQAKIDAAKATRSGDTGKFDQAQKSWDKALAATRRYNEKQPRFPITGDTLGRSIQSRVRARAQAQNGIFLNRKIPKQYDYATED